MAEMRFPFPEGELGTWAALGAVTDRSARIWLRNPEGGTQVAVMRIQDQIVAQAPLSPAADHDWIAAVDLTLDRPAPNASFTIQVAGMVRHGRLAPARDARAAFSFAFGSCHQPFESLPNGQIGVHRGAGIYPAMARVLRARAARFLILLGDQIYSDGIPLLNVREDLRKDESVSDAEILDLYRHLYRGYSNESGFRTLLEEWPGYFIWDDHDIFEGWGSRFKVDVLDLRLFQAAAQSYREYQHLCNPGTTLHDPVPFHYPFWFGDTGFFVLDIRGARDYRTGVLLGERQWTDFEAFLAEADERRTATLFIVASVPIFHIAPALVWLTEWIPTRRGTDVRDRWSARAFNAEREALLERLFDWQAARPERQVIILSGDVHAGAEFRVDRRRPPGTILQWTSSPLTNPTDRSQRLANRVGTRLAQWGESRYQVRLQALTVHNNFGLIDVIPLESGGHQVHLTLYLFDPDSQTLYPDDRAVGRPDTDKYG